MKFSRRGFLFGAAAALAASRVPVIEKPQSHSSLLTHSLEVGDVIEWTGIDGKPTRHRVVAYTDGVATLT